MLKLMADPAALAARIKEYQAAKDAADTAVALVGPAKSIIALRDDAQALRDEAQAIADQAGVDAATLRASATAALDSANAKAAKTKSDADVYAAQVSAATDAAKATLNKAKSDAAAILQDANATAKGIMDSAAATQAQADDLKSQYQELIFETNALRDKYERKLQRLQAASADD